MKQLDNNQLCWGRGNLKVTSKDKTNSEKSRGLLILKLIIGAGVISLISLQLVETYRPEILMSHNKLLSKAFTDTYKGPAFDVLRVRCSSHHGIGPSERWVISYSIEGNTVESVSMSGSSPCLVNPRDNPGYAIIKSKDKSREYTVKTTGEELEQPYSTELVDILLSAAVAGNDELSRRENIDSSWDSSK